MDHNGKGYIKVHTIFVPRFVYCSPNFAPENGVRTLDSKLCSISLDSVLIYIALEKNVLDFAIILKKSIDLGFDFQNFLDDTCRFKVKIGLNNFNLEI